MALKPRYSIAAQKYASGNRKGTWMVRDDKDSCAVRIGLTESEAQSEADRLNAERETRIMWGRAV